LIGSNWSQISSAQGSAANDYFGYAVGISVTGSTYRAALGAFGVNSSTGVDYVYSSANAPWSQEAALYASDGASGDSLGYSVAISGATTFAGAPNRANTAGTIYVFT